MRTLLLLTALLATTQGFFLPGMAPTAVRRTVGSSSTAQVSTDWMDGLDWTAAVSPVDWRWAAFIGCCWIVGS
jgi:hypothetical protein